ncbi:MAG TPA: hypothetical protein VIP11_22525 [Gemmatimonadaceae bacterium]
MSTALLASAPRATRVVHIAADGASLTGELMVPDAPRGIVVFCRTNANGFLHRSDRFVAATLRDAHFATVMFDLLTPEEEMIDASSGHLATDLSRLARRLIDAIDWLALQPTVCALPIGLLGEGPGAAAAIVAACVRPSRVFAVVSRNGNVERASPVFDRLCVPILLIANGNDDTAVRVNASAFRRLRSTKELVLVDGETPAGRRPPVDATSNLIVDWLARYVSSE